MTSFYLEDFLTVKELIHVCKTEHSLLCMKNIFYRAQSLLNCFFFVSEGQRGTCDICVSCHIWRLAEIERWSSLRETHNESRDIKDNH